MHDLIGTWAQIEGQPYPGLAFTFEPDGTFSAVYELMSISSAGTYKTEGELIEMNRLGRPRRGRGARRSRRGRVDESRGVPTRDRST